MYNLIFTRTVRSDFYKEVFLKNFSSLPITERQFINNPNWIRDYSPFSCEALLGELSALNESAPLNLLSSKITIYRGILDRTININLAMINDRRLLDLLKVNDNGDDQIWILGASHSTPNLRYFIFSLFLYKLQDELNNIDSLINNPISAHLLLSVNHYVKSVLDSNIQLTEQIRRNFQVIKNLFEFSFWDHVILYLQNFLFLILRASADNILFGAVLLYFIDLNPAIFSVYLVILAIVLLLESLFSFIALFVKPKTQKTDWKSFLTRLLLNSARLILAGGFLLHLLIGVPFLPISNFEVVLLALMLQILVTLLNMRNNTENEDLNKVIRQVAMNRASPLSSALFASTGILLLHFHLCNPLLINVSSVIIIVLAVLNYWRSSLFKNDSNILLSSNGFFGITPVFKKPIPSIDNEENNNYKYFYPEHSFSSALL